MIKTLSAKSMEDSERKLVNHILYIIGVNSFRLGSLHIILVAVSIYMLMLICDSEKTNLVISIYCYFQTLITNMVLKLKNIARSSFKSVGSTDHFFVVKF